MKMKEKDSHMQSGARFIKSYGKKIKVRKASEWEGIGGNRKRLLDFLHLVVFVGPWLSCLKAEVISTEIVLFL